MTPVRRHSEVDRQAGFTLLEMLAVLTIIAFVATVALPSLRTVNPATMLRASAVDLLSRFRATRTEAMRTSTIRSVIVDVAHRKYWTDDETRAWRIPKGLEIRAEGGAAGASDNGRVTVNFEPDGTSSGANIFLKAGRAKANVAVDWMTGASQVAWIF